jgi:single-stranded-DNA-specific exonuclease
VHHYLNTTDDDILSPLLLDHMEEGAKMLVNHISNNDKIMIIVDSDADGFTSSAILINYLHSLFPSFVENNISYYLHSGKQHGLDDCADRCTNRNDIKLVIVPDAGSSDIKEHKNLHDAGIDVLVLDHHNADEQSAYACIINNQTCDYPTKSLSGAGIVYKFCSYLDSLLNIHQADNYLDLTALGMVADMVSLQDFETRRLITKGIENIQNPFFAAMVEKQEYSLKGEVTPFGISFYIAPFINATIRMGTQEEKTLLFESMLEHKAYQTIPSTKRGCKGQMETKVEQACRNCTNIKNRQTKERDTTLELVEEVIEENNLLENKVLIIQLPFVTNRNLTGLIANQLMSKYQRPVLLLNRVNKDDGSICWEGSGRGCNKSKLNDFRGFLLDSGLTEYCQGHNQAFGSGILDNNISTLIQYANNELKDFDFSPSYKVDFITNSYALNPNDVIELANLNYLWGQSVEEPLVAIEDIKVTKDMVKLMSADKNPTIKISLPNGISIIKFKSNKEEYENLLSEMGCVIINVVGKCEKNVWNGEVNPQILVEDYEIVSKIGYYF